MPPEHIAHEFDERRERGGSEEAILPRVVDRVCWKRMEEISHIVFVRGLERIYMLCIFAPMV